MRFIDRNQRTGLRLISHAGAEEFDLSNWERGYLVEEATTQRGLGRSHWKIPKIPVIITRG